MGLVQRSWVALVIGISLGGCAGPGAEKRGPVDERAVLTFADVYRRSKSASTDDSARQGVAGLTVMPSTGYVKPYLPVIRPPRVIKVWVPSHVASDDHRALVAGHWTFLMLESTRWFIEGEGKP